MSIVYRYEAAEDVRKARRWYDRQRVGLGRAFQHELRRAEELLRRHPAAFPFAHGEYRRTVLKRFPYAIYYRALEASLEIAAVLHQRQDADVLDERGDA